MAITIKDIAKLAGVSRGTVDRVLNNRGNVKADIVDLVEKIAKENNYKPNETAKMLVSSQKKIIIGVVINSVGNAFFDDVIKGIRSCESDLCANIKIEMIELKGYDASEQLDAIRSLTAKGVDALALTLIDDDIIKQELQSLTEQGTKIALINADVENVERLVAVSADNRVNGKIAGDIASLAYPNGCRVAIVLGSKQNASNQKRVEGFLSVLDTKKFDIVGTIENSDSDTKSHMMCKEMIEKNDIDLIYFCAGGQMGGLRAVDESKRDIKAITVDLNSFTKQYLDHDKIIATITQDPYEQGYKSIKALANFCLFRLYPERDKLHTESRVLLKHSKLQ